MTMFCFWQKFQFFAEGKVEKIGLPVLSKKNSTLLKNQNRRKKKENGRLVQRECVCWRPQMGKKVWAERRKT